MGEISGSFFARSGVILKGMNYIMVKMMAKHFRLLFYMKGDGEWEIKCSQ